MISLYHRMSKIRCGLTGSFFSVKEININEKQMRRPPLLTDSYHSKDISFSTSSEMFHQKIR